MVPHISRSSRLWLCVVVVLSSSARAQSHRQLTSFGPYVERSLDGMPVAVCVASGHGGARPAIVVLTQEHPNFRLYQLDDSARVVDSGSFDLPQPQQSVAVAEIDSDRTTEYVTLDRSGTQVTVLHRDGRTFRRQTIAIPGNAQRMAIADFNNDGIPDLLLFGKNTAGVATVMGKKGHAFVPGPLLFPEISVSDLKAADINGDGITDIVLLNWLSNQLMVYYGISRGIFSEQVTLTLPGEPGEIALGPVTRRRTMRAAITLPQEHRIAYLTIDAAGEINTDGTIDCPGAPQGVFLGNVNNDSWLDLVSTTAKGTVVALGSSANDFDPPSVFGPGAGSASWIVADVDGDRKPELVLADQTARRLIVLGNSERTSRVTWPEVYAVGTWPRGLIVRDFDGDGRADICVANSGSSALSFLLSRGTLKFSGPVSVSVPDNPRNVTTAGRLGSPGQTVITTHYQPETIGVVVLAEDLPRSETFAVPTGVSPAVVFARTDSLSDGLAILVRNRAANDGSLTLSLFEQLAGGQFLERSLRPNLPQRIVALTVDDFTGAKGYDLAFVLHDKATRFSTVSLSTGTPSFDFKGVRQLFTYQDSLSSTRTIQAGRVNEDPYADLVMVLGTPTNALAIAYGRGDGTFRDTLEWVRNVRPLREDEIVIRDVNGDGLNDLVFHDADRNAIVALYGVGGGRFSQPAVVAPGKGVTGFAVARLGRHGEEDLVLSYGEKGIISVIVAPFSTGAR